MLEMPPVFLPPLMVKLLSLSIFESGKSWRQVVDIINRDRAMKILCEDAFKEFDENANLEMVIKTLGWKNFRNRLLSLFYVKVKGKKYPHVTLPSEIEELVDFEKRYENFSLKNNSRVLLFALYLMQSEFQLEKDYSNLERRLIEFPLEIDEALALANNKAEELDWLLFMLWHFYEFFGKKDFLLKIKKHQGDYQKLYETLHASDKELLLKNALAYATALGSDEIFFYKRV